MEINTNANIKRLLKEKNIQVKQLAEQLGIAKESASRLINSEITSLTTLKKLSEIFGVSIKEILFGPEPAEPPTQKHICPHCQKEINIKINIE
jgi:transcriptional regulator with XRE-family HTH domain